MIVETNKEKYEVLKDLSLLIPKNFAGKISNIFKPPGEVLKKKQNALGIPISIEEIKKLIVNSRSITFGVTQDCNLRCRYCVYGGKYRYRRTHNLSSMNVRK